MYKSEVVGKGGIQARVVADSVANGVRLTTLELRYPRFIHSEFMTHRMFSRNASSSRAIPVDKMIQQVEENPAMPVHWGKNQPGMQAKEECYEPVAGLMSREQAWKTAALLAADSADDFNEAGYHKQIVNRLLEPFQFISVVVTATEWDNFFKLRLHEDAQPEIYELARVMKEAMNQSEPVSLKAGEWHVPYTTEDDTNALVGMGCMEDEVLETLQAASVARCARVSYLNHDNTEPNIAKDIHLHDKLLEAGHCSPFEHQATPMEFSDYDDNFNYLEGIPHGATHTDGFYWWSGNLRGFVQYRQLLQE